MEKEEVKLIIDIVDMSLTYGVPLVKKLVENIEKDTITAMDIENLRIDKEWDNYFD